MKGFLDLILLTVSPEFIPYFNFAARAASISAYPSECVRGMVMEVTKFRSQLFIALERVAEVLCQTTHSALERTATEGRRLAGEAFHLSRSHLQRLVTISRNAAVATKDKIIRRAFAGLGEVAIRIERAQDMLQRLRRSAASLPTKLQQDRRARENDLRELLANSPDAIIVTDTNRRLIGANPKALVLFGVSEANMRHFTIDIFLSRRQVPESEGNGSPFRTKYGRCEIRRLDGSLRVAECCFFAYFIPRRHVYKFRNVTVVNQYQPLTLRMLGSRNHPHRSDLASLDGSTHR